MTAFDHFHWTKETGFPGYTLRENRGYAQAILTKADKAAPWYGTILAPDQRLRARRRKRRRLG